MVCAMDLEEFMILCLKIQKTYVTSKKVIFHSLLYLLILPLEGSSVIKNNCTNPTMFFAYFPIIMWNVKNIDKTANICVLHTLLCY